MTVEDTDITRIEGQLARIEAKIDAQENRFVTRLEYEARHAALKNDFARLELEQKERDQERDRDAKEMRAQVNGNQTALWKEIALTVTGLILGGGVIGLLNYIHLLTGH